MDKTLRYKPAGRGFDSRWCHWNFSVKYQKKVLTIWENYVTELYDRPNRPETLEVEPEEEVDTDEKSPYILQSEVETAINP